MNCPQIKALWLVLALTAGVCLPTQAAYCPGRIANPITDVCWKCVFPITVGGVPVAGFNAEDFADLASNAPVCTCPHPILGARPGITVSFWEPIRLVDVTTKPYCFVSLGMPMSVDVAAPHGTKARRQTTARNSEVSRAFYHVHYYTYPVTSMLNMIFDFACQEQSTAFDVAYMTELDPLWADDELTFIMNAEAAIFANPVAQLACVADCAAASVGFPLAPLFWCAGCQGSVYPLTGNISGNGVTYSGTAAATLMVERMIFKLHRQGMLWGSVGPLALCGYVPMPLWDKRQYKTQMMYPVPETLGAGPANPWCCNPIGRSTTLWETGKNLPMIGEDFSFLLWRKRSCCAL